MHFRLRSIVVGSLLVAGLLLVGTRPASAATATATVNSISASGVGEPLGTVTFVDSGEGLVIKPKLSGLPPGEHGFHIHEKGDCGPGMNQGKPTAGGHYDPDHTKKASGTADYHWPPRRPAGAGG
jgi:Cu-Zn family superoxide dismutase